ISRIVPSNPSWRAATTSSPPAWPAPTTTMSNCECVMCSGGPLVPPITATRRFESDMFLPVHALATRTVLERKSPRGSHVERHHLVVDVSSQRRDDGYVVLPHAIEAA